MKKLLLSLFISLFGLVSFWFCETVSSKLNNVIEYAWTTTLTSSYTNIFNNGWTYWTYCVKLTSSNPVMLYFWFANGSTSTPSNTYTLYADQYDNWICLYWNKNYFNARLNSSTTTSVSYQAFDLTDLLNEDITCPTCDVCNHCEVHIWFNDIENNNSIIYLNDTYIPDWYAKNYEFFYNSDYNTIDIDNYYKNWDILVNSWVSLGGWTCESDLLQCQNDYSTCENSLWQCWTSLNSCNNALGSCMQWNIWTWEYNRSALFINNIQHLWKPIINITIPEEIDWDYTWNENSFDLTVKWYAVDSDYIQWVIDINSYTPTSEEFTETFVWGLTLIIPYIVLSLFILFIWKLLKKIFR